LPGRFCLMSLSRAHCAPVAAERASLAVKAIATLMIGANGAMIPEEFAPSLKINAPHCYRCTKCA